MMVKVKKAAPRVKALCFLSLVIIANLKNDIVIQGRKTAFKK